MARTELEVLAVPRTMDLTPYIPEVTDEERMRTCVLLGSFGKFHQQILETMDTFESGGVRVLAPKRSPIADSDGFQLLTADAEVMDDLRRRFPQVNWTKDHFAAVIEKIFQETIKVAGFCYIVDPSGIVSPQGEEYPEGYAGYMVAAEIAVAQGSGRPVYAQEPLDEDLDEKEGIIWPPFWKATAREIKVYNPQDMIQMVESGQLDEEDYPWCPGYVWKWPRPERKTA